MQNNPTEITHLSQLNLQFMCFEPDPISIPLTAEEREEQDYILMIDDDLRYETDMEWRDIEAEWGEED